MLFRSIQNLIKVPLVLAVFWMLLFGLSQMTMDMSMMDGKANCPLGGHSIAICQMDPMEHIQEGQSMITMLPTQNLISLFFAIFALLIISRLKFWSRFSIPEPPLVISGSQSSLISFQIFNPFKELFSSGIFNPKIF